jgi:hypothetical protein
MKVAETACWNLMNTHKIFGMENIKESSHINSDAIYFSFHRVFLFYFSISLTCGISR